MKKTRRSGERASASATKLKSRRNVVVMASLIGSLGLTSIALLAIAPAPLTPEVAVVAADTRSTFEPVFAPNIKAVQWRYIYIHHSKTRRGFAQNVGGAPAGDHFLIGNGDGCPDGEIQITDLWQNQSAATTVTNHDVISICLVGDFDQTGPTANQVDRLADLVTRLQRELRIPRSNVRALPQAGTSGIGKLFPAAKFSQYLLP